MLFRLLVLFTLIPLTELWLLTWVADQTGWRFTILLVLATGILGASLARWQGWKTVERIQRSLQQGKIPTDSLLDGAMILLAGTVLITPGILTDVFGFMLLMPWCRNLIKRYTIPRLASRVTMQTSQFSWPRNEESVRGRDEIIDVRIVEPSSLDSDTRPGA